MWKMTSWLAKAVAAALIVSFLSIWTTGYIVNSYVETVLKQFNIPLQTQPFALSGMWGKLWGADAPGGSETADKDKAAKDGSGAAKGTVEAENGSASGASGSGEGGTAGSGSDSGSGEDGSPPSVDAFGQEGETYTSGTGSGPKAYGSAADSGEGEAGTAPDGAASGVPDSPAAGAGGVSEEGGGDDGAADAAEDDRGAQAGADGGALTPSASVSTEQMNEAKQQMSAADQSELFTLMAKLPQEAWQTIAGYLEDGLTQEELTGTDQILAQNLSRDEYEKIKEILKKY